MGCGAVLGCVAILRGGAVSRCVVRCSDTHECVVWSDARSFCGV